MYEEFNPLEHVLLEDVLDVDVGLDCGSGGVHLGVPGGVSSLTGTSSKSIFRTLAAILRFDRRRCGFPAAAAEVEEDALRRRFPVIAIPEDIRLPGNGDIKI